MKKLSAALAFLVLSAASAPAGQSAGPGEGRPIVVEVYTSQGCNTCVPANILAAKVAQKPGILLLSFAVTYWDMFGWKDTLATDDNTRRQKAYAASLRRGGVYTPQMIIDGVKDVPAAREDAVSYALALASMARDDGQTPDVETPSVARRDRAADVATVAAARVKTLARSAWSVPVTLIRQHGVLRVAVDRAPEIARRSNVDATVWLFRVRSNATVKIGGGENNGQTVAYKNVVVGINNIGRWKGDALAIDLPKPQTNPTGFDSIAVVVQQGGYGRVMGAAFIHNVMN